MYNVGQADNLLSAGKVAYPKYEIGSLKKDDYSCEFRPPDNSKPPVSIPLGTYHDYASSNYDLREPYVHTTQHTTAGELSDKAILIISILLFAALCICTMLSFK